MNQAYTVIIDIWKSIISFDWNWATFGQIRQLLEWLLAKLRNFLAELGNLLSGDFC